MITEQVSCSHDLIFGIDHDLLATDHGGFTIIFSVRLIWWALTDSVLPRSEVTKLNPLPKGDKILHWNYYEFFIMISYSLIQELGLCRVPLIVYFSSFGILRIESIEDLMSCKQC